MEKKLNLPVIIPAAIGLLIVMTAAFVWFTYGRGSRQAMPVYGQVPEFDFTECRGARFGLEHLKGKISVVDFIFTTCKTACPVMSAKMEMLYHLFKAFDEVQFVSITVDPEHDTPEVLQEYAKRYGVVDRRWVFLWAPFEEVRRLAETGFKVSAGPENMHSTKFILVDPLGQVRGYYDPYDNISLNRLKEDIRELIKKGS